ncbi:MAG TPA: molybdopterin-guanine dinucleotide biosynthesis protein B [Reyranella sp.]|nr:molybdopterin-guanine dinucleotide biosynthesis protein B [Reyranella sp.]
MSGRRIIGVVGWKNAGKTTLVARLVAEFRRRGWRVSTIKHAHHNVDIDQRGTDSWQHRAAGATEVALVGGLRYAIMREQPEATLEEVLARMAPADLILIEGFKREPHPKIEIRGDHTRPLAKDDPSIIAIAADERPPETHLPWFTRDDIAMMVDFIMERVG